MKTTIRIGRPTLYLVTAYMVFLTIYTLGLRINIFTTAFDLIEQKTGFIYWYGIMIAGCAFVGAWMIFVARKTLKKWDCVLLGALLAWMTLTVPLTSDPSVKENLSGVIAIGVTVVTFYLVGRSFDRDLFNFVIKRVILWGSVVWNVGCIISLGMYLANYSGYYHFGGFIRTSRQGIMEGRLFGCFSDPNYAAMISLLIMAGLFYLYRTMVPSSNKTLFARVTRIYIIFCACLYVIYIVLSGSRSSETAVIITQIIMTILMTYRKRKNPGDPDYVKKPVIQAYGLRLLVVLVVMVAVYFAIMFAMQGVGVMIAPDRDVETELERDDVSVENISNSRVDIWIDYLTLVKDRPIWGFSSRGALPYARQLDEHSYLSEKGYNPHSMFIQMIVQAGVVGFILMMVFLFWIFIRIFKRCKDDTPVNHMFLLSICVILVHGVFCIFNVGIFITPCFEAMLAWIGLGYLSQACYSLDEKKEIRSEQ